MDQNVGVKDVVFVILFSTLIFFGAFFLFSSLKKPTVKRQVSVRSLERKIGRRVNKKIQELETRNRIFKSKIRSVEAVVADDIDDVFFKTDSRYELNVFEGQDSDEEVRPQNAAERVRALLSLEDRTMNEKQVLIEQYKEQLVERAREQGWAIEINDSLEVISARRL